MDARSQRATAPRQGWHDQASSDLGLASCPQCAHCPFLYRPENLQLYTSTTYLFHTSDHRAPASEWLSGGLQPEVPQPASQPASQPRGPRGSGDHDVSAVQPNLRTLLTLHHCTGVSSGVSSKETDRRAPDKERNVDGAGS